MFMEEWIAKEKIVKFSIVVKFNTHTGRAKPFTKNPIQEKSG